MTERIDISTFKHDSRFYGRLEMLLTVKSFDLQAIRQRYLKSKSRKDNRTGSVERREVAVGGIVHAVIEDGKLIKSDVLARLKEPRGIGLSESYLGISAENEVHIIGDNIKTLRDPWFSYIHTVDFHPTQNKILVSSSGLDCVLEYDLNSFERSFEWFAWEHGFNKGKDPQTGEEVTLTRNPDVAGDNVKVISDPKSDVLPTAMRAAFINSVVYDSADSEHLIATFFHEGAVYRVNIRTGEVKRMLSGLKNPHGGGRNRDMVYATSTGSGEVKMNVGGAEKILNFHNLDGKPAELKEMEWLQNSHFDKNHLVTIDSNRTAFVISDLENNEFDQIDYNPDWAVQDMVIGTFTKEQLDLIRSLSL